MEIICAGYPKTGTKSCSSALRALGYNLADWMEKRVVRDFFSTIFRATFFNKKNGVRILVLDNSGRDRSFFE